jgi:hypothetical protein
MNSTQTAWKAVLNDAVNETDPAKVVAKTRAAETAIFNRIAGAWPSPGFAEERELFEALAMVRLLRKTQRLRPTGDSTKSKDTAGCPLSAGFL